MTGRADMLRDQMRQPFDITAVEETTPGAQGFRILFVVPTLGERLTSLERTLASVQQQGGVSVDIVLVVKTTTPELCTIADRYRARVVCHPGNISAAINAGFSKATEAHRYGAWLGDDDILLQGALAKSSALLESNPSAVVSYGVCDYVDLNGRLLFSRRPPPNAPTLLQFIPGLIKQETCLFRLDALRAAGGLDETLKYTMDLDLLLKLRRLGPFVWTNLVLAAFCWHPGSLTIANRRASLIEAQSVQCKHARGGAAILQRLWKYPFRYLILAMNWNINRGLK